MRLVALDLRRLPGIREPFSVRFEGSLSVVTGPNAVGKSSLARAVRAVLWPDTLASEICSVRATFATRDGELIGERDGTRTRWYRDGQPVDPPAVPERHLAGCFTIAIDDLLAANQSTAELARRVRNELAGGYDLAAVSEAAAFSARRSHGRDAAQALSNADRQVREIEHEHQTLDATERELPALRAAFAAAEADRHEHQQLQEARALVAARATLAACERRVAGFPAALGILIGDEGQQLDSLRQRRSANQTAARAAARAIDDATATIQATRLPAAGIPPITLDELHRWLQRLEAAQRAQDDATQALTRATTIRRAALETLTGVLDTPPADVPLGDVTAVEDWLRRSERNLHERAAIEEQLQQLPTAESGDPEALRTLAATLRSWLLTPDDVIRVPLLGWVIVLAIGIIALSAVLARQLHPYWSAAGAAAVIIPPLGLLYGATRIARQRRDLRAAATATTLGLPTDWTRPAVVERLREVERAIVQTERGRELDQERARLLTRQAGLEETRARIAADRDALVTGFGFAPHATDAAVVAFAGAVRTLVTSTIERAAATDAHARLGATVEQALAAINGRLEATGQPAIAESVGAAAALVDLTRREQTRHEATRRLEDARQHAEHIERQLADDSAAETALFDRFGLDARADTTLRQWLEQLADYRQARAERERAAAAVEAGCARLANRPDLLNCSSNDLDPAWDATSTAEARAVSLRDDITRRTERIDAARRAHRLTDALAARTAAHATAEDARHGALLAAAGRFIIARAATEYERISRPPVLEHAASLFGRITQHAYRLEFVAGEPPSFAALDVDAQERRALHELSSGTRMQLLIAVRLAFANSSERGEPLPVFLDEALTSSDPHRTAELVGALRELADAHGRQVIYLTAQPADVLAFVRDGRPGEVQVVAVGDERRRAIGSADLRLLASADPEWPSPHGLSPAEYAARIGVPPLDGDSPFERTHLFYALHDDLETLHALLRAGYTTAGPTLELLDAPPEETAILGARASLTAARTRIAITRLIRDAWRLGRGRPVDSEVIRQSPLADTVYVDRVIDIAGEVRGDARALLQVLRDGTDERLRNFRKDKRAKFEAFLTDNHYLDTELPLADDEILQRVIRAAARLDNAPPLEAIAGHTRWMLRQLGSRASATTD